jgi:hypothetical protein
MLTNQRELLVNFLIKILFAISLLFVALPAYSWGWDRDYESCVLNHIEDAKSEKAAWLVQVTCRKKFPMTEEECVKKEEAKGNEYAALACYRPKK